MREPWPAPVDDRDVVANPVPGPDLLRLQRGSDYLAARFGLHFPPDRYCELAAKLERLAPAVGCRGSADCLDWLLTASLDAAQQETVAGHLTVGETYFFREPAAFAALERELLPPLLHRRAASGERRLRLWSAGCSSGEEAWSLAIVADRLLPDRRGWNVSVLGTDVNAGALATAAHGVYRAWSFRGGNEAYAASFTPTADGRRRVADRLRPLCSFAPLNLAGDGFPAPETNTDQIDVIFCRNVLMYFRPDRARATLARLADCLVDGGWLAVAAVESPLVDVPGLVTDSRPGVILFRKIAVAAGVSRAASASSALSAPAAAATMRPAAVPPRHRPQVVPRRPPRPAGETADELVAEAHALANAGRLDEALAQCERAVARDKLNPAHTYLQASILIEQGRLDAAAAALRRTLYLDPERPLAHFSLANLLVRCGEAAGSRRHYRQARALLERLPGDAVLAESGGVVAGRLLEVVDSLLADEVAQ